MTSELEQFVMGELEWYRKGRWLRRLSQKTGIDYKNVWEWANGVRKPTLASMELLLDAMGYDLVIRRRDGRHEMQR